jgi:hypothetical protein
MYISKRNQGRKEPVSSGDKCKGSYKYEDVYLVRKNFLKMKSFA